MRHRVLIGIGDVGFGNLVGVAFFAHTNQLPLGTGSKGIDGFLVGGSFFHGEIVCPISTSVGENLAVALIVVDGGDAPFYIGRLFQFVIGDFTQGRQHHYGAIVYGTGVVGAVWDEHTVFIKRSTFCGVAPHAIAESDGIGVDVGAFLQFYHHIGGAIAVDVGYQKAAYIVVEFAIANHTDRVKSVFARKKSAIAVTRKDSVD